MASTGSYEEWEISNGGGVSEIQEEEFDENNVNGGVANYGNNGAYQLGSIEEEGGGSWSEREEKTVYVLVGKESEETLSMDALMWTISNAVVDPSSDLVFLVHVFPEFCEVKIICEGKEISKLATTESPSPSPSPSPRATDHSTPKLAQNQDETKGDSIACGCFKI